MTFLAETLGVVGVVTVAAAVGGDSELCAQVGGLVPVDGSTDLVGDIAFMLADAGLPERVVLAHPDVLVAEALLAGGHDVVVVVVPRAAGGPDVDEVRAAHPGDVVIAELSAGFADLTVFNSGLLLVGVATPAGFAIQRLGALALERLSGRFPRRYALSFATMGRAPRGWVVISRARISRCIGATYVPSPRGAR